MDQVFHKFAGTSGTDAVNQVQDCADSILSSASSTGGPVHLNGRFTASKQTSKAICEDENGQTNGDKEAANQHATVSGDEPDNKWETESEDLIDLS